MDEETKEDEQKVDPEESVSEAQEIGTSCDNNTEKQEETKQETFKKPVLIGKIGKFPRKVVDAPTPEKDETKSLEVTDCQKSEEFAVPAPKKPRKLLETHFCAAKCLRFSSNWSKTFSRTAHCGSLPRT